MSIETSAFVCFGFNAEIVGPSYWKELLAKHLSLNQKEINLLFDQGLAVLENETLKLSELLRAISNEYSFCLGDSGGDSQTIFVGKCFCTPAFDYNSEFLPIINVEKFKEIFNLSPKLYYGTFTC